MKITMKRRILLTLIIAVVYSAASASALTFYWNGTGTSWTSSSSWNETGGSGDYPGSGSRTTDIVRFGVTGSSYTNQPTLTTSLTIASIEFGGGIEAAGTDVTVTGVTLTVGTITQDINTTTHSNTIYDYLQGTGTVTCATITVGSGTSISGSFNFLLSDVATLNVSGNVVIISNVNKQNGCGFRLENGNMYLAGQVTFTTLSGITASNASYFTINTVAQAGGNTTPHLYLSNANPLGTIPTPKASVNFYGDHGGTGTVTYTAASPTVYTTSTAGFGTGGGTIDTSKASYDNLTIQGTGTSTVGGATLGALKVAGNLTTASTTTFNTTGGTNTSVGGSWTNSATVTMGTGSTAVSGSITNSAPMTLSSGILEVGGSVSNTSTITAGSGNITIDANLTNSSALTLSSGNLTVGGNYTNSSGATFTAGSGTVDFNGASAQALVDNSTGGTTLNNVEFTGGGTKTMSGAGSFAVSSSGVLTMAASNTLQTGGILTLNSASTGSATVAAIPSTASITGNVNVQRYISGGSNAYRGYRLLSSPVYTASSGSNYYYSLAYLASYAPITGTNGTVGGLTKTGNPSMYLYRDNQAFTNSTFNTGNFRGVNTINNTPAYAIGVDYDGTYNLHVGTGVMFFYRGNLSNIATKYITTTSAEANLFMSTGTLNQQAITVTNWYTQLPQLQCSVVTGNAGYSGFNLVGNPYASSIDWNTFSTTSSTAGVYGPSVSNTIYIFNEVSKVYAAYNGSLGTNGGSNIIPSGQGFFVKATVAGASLTFNEAAKTNSQLTGPTQPTGTTLLLSAMPVAGTGLQYLRLEMAADSINKDETVICFNSAAKNQYVVNEDSQYLPGSGEVGLSSMSADSVKLAINTVPFPKLTQTAIKLNVNATADGLYSLNMTGIMNIPPLFQVWLMDGYNKDSLDIKHNPTYKFNVSLNDTNSFGSNRFSLVIREDPALGVHLLNFTATKATNGAQVAWKTENEQNYTNFAVERRTNGGATFADLAGFVSSAVGTYTFLDKDPVSGPNQYRLKIIDLNGSITYSQVVTLMYGNNDDNIAKNPISIYPNPAASTINLAIAANANAPSNTGTSSTYDIKIMSSNGLVVKSATFGQTSWQDNVSNLQPGTYVVEVINNNDKSVVGKSKFVKL